MVLLVLEFKGKGKGAFCLKKSRKQVGNNVDKQRLQSLQEFEIAYFVAMHI